MNTTELTPLNDRLAVFQVGRGLLGMGVAVGAVVAPNRFGVSATTVVIVASAYVVATTAFEVGRRRSRRRVISVVTTCVLVDAVLLATATAVSGGLRSPFVPACFLHITGTTLLVSYRTGLKASVAYALAVPVEIEAGSAGWFEAPAVSGPFSPATSASVFLAFAVGTAVCSSFNERALREGRRDYELRARFAVLLNQQREPDEVVSTLATFVKEELGFEQVVVLRRVDGELRGVAVGAGGTGEVSEGLDCPPRDDPAVVQVPLLTEGLEVGRLRATWAGPARRRVPVVVAETVQELVGHAALALRQAELHVELEHRAGHDSLTGLLNRRAALERMEAELGRASRSGESVALVFLDLDRFKSVNDSLGHEAGDDVLRAVGRVLLEAVRGHDLAARLGGEEFVVLLTDSDGDSTIAATERIRRSIRDASGGRVTASAGIAIGPEHSSELAELMRLADAALYNAKRSGRDRSCVAVPPVDRRAGAERVGEVLGGEGSGSGSATG